MGLAVEATAATFYVSTTGNDTWSGTRPDPGGNDGPFATLERARDAIRTLKAAGPLAEPVTVYLRGGIYELAQALKLVAEDSGTTAAPVVYRAYEQEQPILIGGKTVTGWRPFRDGIMQTDVGTQGFRDIYFRQLFFAGKRQILARYPNADPEDPVAGGWAYVDGDPIPMYQTIEGESRRTFQYKPGDVHDWAHPEEIEAVVFPRYNWWNNIIRVASIDREKRLVTLAGDASYPNRPNDRYYFRNVFEELDAPGEWYLDQRTWTLYFLPPGDLSQGVVYAPTLESLLELDSVEYVTFRGLTLECADGTAVVLKNCTECRVAASTVRNVGSRATGDESGIAIHGGHRNGAVGNDIYEVGSNAVSLDGGDPKTLEPAENYADNNYIHHVGVFYKQGVGVALGGVGNRVSHNLIHDCPRFGVIWGGNDQIIECNHIRHCTLETADTGAIYSWQVDWAKRGTEIRYNYLHDIIGFGQENGKWTSPHMNWGIYLDDGTCGTHVHDNVVARTVLGGVHVHGGRDNVIENNILIDGRDFQLQYSGYVAERHPVPTLTEHWNAFSGTPAYDKYPGYVELKESLAGAWQMAGNKFLRNIVAYSNPNAALFKHYNLPMDKTESDYNLYWHQGLPLRTGVAAVKGTTGPNQAPNPSFEGGKPGELPAFWQWQIRPKDSAAAVDTTAPFVGKQCLRLDGRGFITDAAGQTLRTNFVSDEIPLQSGKTYRLGACVKGAAPDTAFTVMVQAYIPNQFFWAKAINGKAGPQWQEVEALFTFPAPGDPNYKPGMDRVRIRIDVAQEVGTIWIDNVSLLEAVAMSEWEAWQAKGLDLHSVIADPQFVAPATDDYRLKPGSPAFALGFKPIPVDQIGPYQDELRASWPIREARGVRETVKYDWSTPAPAASLPRTTIPFVAKRTAAPAVDGTLAPDEWPESHMTLRQDPSRHPVAGPACQAFACHDGTTLYVAITVQVADPAKVKLGPAWGKNDGAEVCFQDLSGADRPVFVVHGFPSGEVESVTDAGAPVEAAAKLGAAVRFAAKISGSQWTGEWAIPLAAAGIQYTPGLRLAFNTGVNRTQTGEWVIWAGPLGETWRLNEAGYLILE